MQCRSMQCRTTAPRASLPLVAVLLLTAVAPVASSERPAISGLVHQAPQTETGWFSVSSGAEICAFSPSAPDRGRENCWPALGGRATDLAGGSDGFLAAGHAAADGFIDLFLVAGEGDTVTPLPLPPSNGLPRGSARLVADDGRLLGLVWLEGHRQEDLELRAARWLGSSWEGPRHDRRQGAGRPGGPGRDGPRRR